MLLEWFAVSMLSLGVVYGGRHEDRLISDIFVKRNHSSLARPVQHEAQAVEVVFGVTLQSIINVDEKKETLVSRLWLNYAWNDYKLRWNPEEYGGVDNIRVPWDKIWTPDILLYNSADEDIDSKFPVNVIVSHDGNCKWMPLGIYVSSCSIDIKWFPFDEQTCKMKFGSWTYDGTLINLTNFADAMETEAYQKNGEWDLLGAPAKLTHFFYECCPDNPYIDISYYLHIRRRYLYYGSNLIIPCALISSLAVFTFALPPDTNAKVSLGITILLALSVFQLIVAEMVPSTSLSVPLIGAYFALLMVLCTVSLIITIIVINFHHRKPEMSKISPFIDKYINNYLAWFLRMSRPGRKPKSPFSKSNEGLKPMNLETTKFMVPSLPHPNSPNSRFSSYLSSQQSKINTNLSFQNGSRYRTNQDRPQEEAVGPALKGSLLKLKHELGAILNEMKFITSQAKDNDAASEEVNDWKFAAMVIDRFCFAIFTIILVVGTAGIFLSSSNLRASLGMGS